MIGVKLGVAMAVSSVGYEVPLSFSFETIINSL
jgi:hypothetical protein